LQIFSKCTKRTGRGLLSSVKLWHYCLGQYLHYSFETQKDNIEEIYYSEDNAVTNMGRQDISSEHLSQIVNNINTQECAHQDGGDDGQGLQGREGDGGGGRGGRDDGQAYDQYDDSAQFVWRGRL
jgi:hypothetical protein